MFLLSLTVSIPLSCRYNASKNARVRVLFSIVPYPRDESWSMLLCSVMVMPFVVSVPLVWNSIEGVSVLVLSKLISYDFLDVYTF